MPKDRITEKERRFAERYGSPVSTTRAAHLSREEAVEIQRKFFAGWPQLRAWWETQNERLKRVTGYPEKK